MPPRRTIWPLDAHTLGKHKVLEGYLKAWFPILGLTSNRILFIDGFAGPGRCEKGEEGSPLIAIRTLKEHTAKKRMSPVLFWFIERDKQRVDHLRQLIDGLGEIEGCSIEITGGAFDETLAATLDNIGKDQTLVLLEQVAHGLALGIVVLDHPDGIFARSGDEVGGVCEVRAA